MTKRKQIISLMPPIIRVTTERAVQPGVWYLTPYLRRAGYLVPSPILKREGFRPRPPEKLDD